MGDVLSLYPTLTSAKNAKAQILSQTIELSYNDDYDNYPLEIKDIEGVSQKFRGVIKDPRCVWYPETHNIIIRKQGRIEHPDVLFGINGIAAHDAILGIAGIWSSKKADLHGTINYGSFELKPTPFEFDRTVSLERGTVKGDIKFKLVVYLVKSGNPYPDEMHLANISGTVLGVIDEWDIILEGSGSVFPIVTVNEPRKPLWWVKYEDACDPFQDLFDEENVEIRLNKAHPCYDDLNIEESLKGSPLFLEVISSALNIIITSVRDSVSESDWDEIVEGQNLTPGTIAEAVSYFINKLQWDISSPSALAMSIHQYFDDNL